MKGIHERKDQVLGQKITAKYSDETIQLYSKVGESGPKYWTFHGFSLLSCQACSYLTTSSCSPFALCKNIKTDHRIYPKVPATACVVLVHAYIFVVPVCCHLLSAWSGFYPIWSWGKIPSPASWYHQDLGIRPEDRGSHRHSLDQKLWGEVYSACAVPF